MTHKKHVVGRVAYQWFSMVNSGFRGLGLRPGWSLCCFLGQLFQEDYTLTLIVSNVSIQEYKWVHLNLDYLDLDNPDFLII